MFQTRRTVLAVTAVALLAIVACSGPSDGQRLAPTTTPGSPAGTTAASTAGSTPGTAPTGTAAPPRGLADQYGVRYCEVLSVTITETSTKAEVWGTQGLNECPQAAFAALDAAAVRDRLGVTLALLNGPRYWVLDDIVAHQIAGSGEIRDFGGIEMRSIATVDLGTGIPDRRPYVGIAVKRDTAFSFDAGRTVYELTAPDGSTYIMQSYTLEVDPTQDVAALAGLASKLQLPPGWSFTSRVLTETLVVEDVDGYATVIQDDLRNSYQLRSRP